MNSQVLIRLFLFSRFLINIPEEERKDIVRLCFQIETAHWFYVDFHRQEHPELPPCGLKDFTKINILFNLHFDRDMYGLCTSHLKPPHPPIRALARDYGDFHLIYTSFWFPGRREFAWSCGLRIPYRVICCLLKDQSVYFMAANSVF